MMLCCVCHVAEVLLSSIAWYGDDDATAYFSRTHGEDLVVVPCNHAFSIAHYCCDVVVCFSPQHIDMPFFLLLIDGTVVCSKLQLVAALHVELCTALLLLLLHTDNMRLCGG